jgi:hypothetical protein
LNFPLQGRGLTDEKQMRIPSELDRFSSVVFPDSRHVIGNITDMVEFISKWYDAFDRLPWNMRGADCVNTSTIFDGGRIALNNVSSVESIMIVYNSQDTPYPSLGVLPLIVPQ